MKEITILFLTILGVIGSVSIYNKNKNVTVLKSTNDNRKYRLLDLPGKEKCMEILVQLNKNVIQLLSYVKNEEREGIQDLLDNYRPDSLCENLENRSLQAYSLNKGEEICLCLREPENELEIIDDMNTLMFVLVHELSHLMTDDIGHTNKFWNNMAYLLKKANEINLYTPINYSVTPVMYCGVKIDETPYIF
tara:strand:- start:64 stop:639 length:576 start_codon:yes stop_codon:yes gene_type:complete